MRQNDPTQEVLQMYFDFSSCGCFIWKKRAPHSNVKLGSVAGRLNAKNNRFQVCVGGKVFPLARMIWIWHYGAIPNNAYVDHADGNPLNNELSNLRLATPSENATNKKANRYKYAGWRGVYKQNKRWMVGVRKNGEFIYLGMFDCDCDAATAYNFAACEVHGPYARYNSVPQPWLDNPGNNWAEAK